ncbi:DoxX family protein [Flavobacterium amnicola]|uniref:DoxX family protein n=1 Tax=Flavobacterium amnicola TaxID=2506422 RepID=A0A4Q1K4E0_9FLAO|nr:DoxX family protein [Flavobacterium amnicola]RXR18274.1 DoxX family protein [Flavobacterium amnicola]
MSLPWHLYIMALLYFVAGINHFRNPRIYLKIIPAYLPNPKLINSLSGLAEIILAIGLCIPFTSKLSAWGIIALLMAIFPANLYMLQNEQAALRLPKWVRLIRLPLQGILIYWAFIYTS